MKTVIVSGANGNLGLTVVQELLERSYHVVAIVAEEKGKSSFAAHPNLDIYIVNLGNEIETEAFVQQVIQKYNSIDAALLLAGGFTAGAIADTTGADLQKQISLNFETAYYLTRPLFAHMTNNNSGSLVFVGARPAINPSQGKNLMAYSLSKSLLFKLAENLNEAAKGTNVRVSIVIPSTIDTPLNRKSMPDVNPDNWVKPKEIAEILEFIVSDKAKTLREPIFKIYNNS